MKKRIISLMLSIAVVFSCFPLFTLQADAFSTGAKYLLKTRTVTIKPGKTYKSPKFRASSKMTFQVPVKINPVIIYNVASDRIKIPYRILLKSCLFCAS